MPKIAYIEKKFRAGSLETIKQANQIINDYLAQGFKLTLRQLYYQFVSRDLIPNTVQEYKRLGGIINDARLAGMIDWSSIEDRTRNLKRKSFWDGPDDIIRSCVRSFNIDMWAPQKHRVEVWIEKEALAGVFQKACGQRDVPFFSCRGYTSQSEMWVAARRLIRHAHNGHTTVVLHFGDHDPSGIDMSRDIEERLLLFGAHIQFKRIALNMDQVEEYDPPPNPAKQTDSRFRNYNEIYGDESWELDALDPTTLSDLVLEEVDAFIDHRTWEASKEELEEGRSLLERASDNWDSVVEVLNDLAADEYCDEAYEDELDQEEEDDG